MRLNSENHDDQQGQNTWFHWTFECRNGRHVVDWRRREGLVPNVALLFLVVNIYLHVRDRYWRRGNRQCHGGEVACVVEHAISDDVYDAVGCLEVTVNDELRLELVVVGSELKG